MKHLKGILRKMVMAYILLVLLAGCKPVEEASVAESTTVQNKTTTAAEVKTTTATKSVTEKEAETTEDPVATSETEETTEVTETTEAKTEIEEDRTEVNQASKDLNAEGFGLYKEGDYEGALALFEASIEADETYYLAHFNYACTIGVLMKEDYPIWYEYRSEAHDHLAKVAELHPDYMEKIKSDSDLDLFRKDFKYMQLLGYGTESDGDIRYLLTHMDWYINGPGVVTPIGEMTYNDNGTYSLQMIDLVRLFEGDGQVVYKVFEGSFSVQQGQVFFESTDRAMLEETFIKEGLTLPAEGPYQFKGYLEEDGTLITDLITYPIHNWKDEFSA